MSRKNGGFRNNFKVFKDNFSDLKSSSAKPGVTAPITPKNFDYTDGKGIWSLDSTVAFPKQAPLVTDIVYVNAAPSQSSTNSTSTVINVPTGILAGDLMLFIINMNYTNNFNTPAGWTVGAAGASFAFYYKIAGASETSFTMTHGSGRPSAIVAAYRYAAIDSVGSISSSATIAGTTTTVNNATVFLAAGKYRDSTLPPTPTNFTIVSSASGTNDAPCALFSRSQVVAGPSGTATSSLSHYGIQFSLRLAG